MSKKKEIKNIFDNMEPESSEAHAEPTQPANEKTGQDAATPNTEQPGDEADALRAEMLAAEQTDQNDDSSTREPVEDEEAGLRAEMLAAEGQEQPSPELEPEPAPSSEDQAEVVESSPEMNAADETPEESPDDLLDDVRKSLLEEEANQEEQPKWWRRIGRSSRKKNVEEGPAPVEEINLPSLAAMQAMDTAAEAGAETETDEYEGQLDDLIDMLQAEEEPVETDSAVVPYGSPVQPEVEPEPEKPVDLDELKRQAFQSRPEGDEKESLTEVRAIALEGDEEAFVEVEAAKPDQLEERLTAVDNALKPYQRYINFGLAFVGLVMAIAAAFLLYNAYQRSVAQSAPTPVVSDVPYPTSVGLPGGWQFNLGKGSLTADGSWNPTGAEWLQGTEVCRWVALPWSRQLEAVIRTLDQKDPIELGMSNNDKLTYDVYSIKQMSPAEMRELDTNKPCLLVVLVDPNAEKRWVLTALP
jgi:hypothetical protein